MEIINIPIDEITPDPNNAKDHPRWQIEQIKNSIEQFGNLDPIGIWGDENLIVEGHGRYEALKELGYHEAECIRLDWLTEEERRAYAITHNALTMNSGWLEDKLQMNLEEISGIDMSVFGFVPEDYAEELGEIDEGEFQIPDDALEHEPKAKLGDIYQLGRHRLMCGSSTDANDIDRLIGGAVMDLVITDPPYNVNYGDKAEMLGEYEKGHRNTKKILNDNMDDASFFNFLFDFYTQMMRVLKEGGAYYIFHADTEGLNFRSALKAAGGSVRECLIWVKNQLVLGRQDYQWKHEPCLYGWKDGAGHYFIDDRKQTTVMEDKIDIDSMSEQECRDILKEIYFGDKIATTILHENKPTVNDLHPTMKPVKLIARLMVNSSKQGENVFDGFGGSGSTLMAAEQLGRNAYLMELDPKFIDAIIERWERYTGEKAVKIG